MYRQCEMYVGERDSQVSGISIYIFYMYIHMYVYQNVRSCEGVAHTLPFRLIPNNPVVKCLLYIKINIFNNPPPAYHLVYMVCMYECA